MAEFAIRNLVSEDIPALLCLPQSEGREMGMEPEIQAWLEVDPHGLFIAVCAENGQIAGCCCGIALSAHHGYIGMYVVRPKYRGLGLGRVLWDAARARLGNRNISLSSVEKMYSFYKDKAGFSVVADWTIDLYSSKTVNLPTEPFVESSSVPLIVAVTPLEPLVECLLNYDSSIHNYDRSRIVKATISESGTLTVMAIQQTVGDACTATGYACMKKSMQGHWLIAPVYAENYVCAYSLVYGLLSSLQDSQRKDGVVVKLISSNWEASKLFLNFGMKKSSYQLKRLFTKEVFQIPENKVFALQSSVFCTE